MQKINIYQAIELMRVISKEDRTFSIKFRKYNRKTGKGGDVVRIKAARVRPKPGNDKVKNSDHKLFLVDTETGDALVCWHILIMEFNGMKTTL